MSATGVKSQPGYVPLVPDLTGTQHLLIGCAEGFEPLLRLLTQLPGLPCCIDLHYLPAAEQTGGKTIESNRLLDQVSGTAVRIYAGLHELHAGLKRRFEASDMGTRIYLAGPESFLWTVTSWTRDFAIREDQIRREACGSQARRVLCVHCKTITPDIREPIAACSACGRVLGVRDHFSRRLNAYLGVATNIETSHESSEPGNGDRNYAAS